MYDRYCGTELYTKDVHSSPWCSHCRAPDSDLATVVLTSRTFGAQQETQSSTTAAVHGLKIFQCCTQCIALRYLSILSLC